MDTFITNFLANIFDSFKAKNPQIAAIILLILGAALFLIENGLADLIGKDLANVGKWLVFILAALQGSRTTSFLTEKKK